MSETVHYEGSLTKIHREVGETLEEQSKRLMAHKPLPTYQSSYTEWLLDERSEEIMEIEGELYAVERTRITDDSVYNAYQINENKIGFEVCYYNGGCSFEEAIGDAISQMRKKGNT